MWFFQKLGSACAIIGSVLDCDPKYGRTIRQSTDKVIEFVKNNNLKIEGMLETHARLRGLAIWRCCVRG